MPPTPTDLFVKTIGETDWRLTDEHRDDNSQQSFTASYRRLHVSRCGSEPTEINEAIDAAVYIGDSAERRRLRERCEQFADEYDDKLDELLYLIDNALSDLARRIDQTTLGN